MLISPTASAQTKSSPAELRRLDGDAVQEIGFSHGFGRSVGNRELVEWMRGYNADAARDSSGKRELRFYGFDSPTEMMNTDSPGRVLNFVLGYLESVDASCGQEFRQRIEPLIGDDAVWETTEAAFDPTKIEPTDELITQVIPLRQTDAMQLKNDLAPLIDESQAVFTANSSSNSLVITDTSANIRRMSGRSSA